MGERRLINDLKRACNAADGEMGRNTCTTEHGHMKVIGESVRVEHPIDDHPGYGVRGFITDADTIRYKGTINSIQAESEEGSVHLHNDGGGY